MARHSARLAALIACGGLLCYILPRGVAFLEPRPSLQQPEVAQPTVAQRQLQGIDTVDTKFASHSASMVGAVVAVLALSAAGGRATQRRSQRKVQRKVRLDEDFVLTGTVSSPQAMPPGWKPETERICQAVIPSGEIEPTMSDDEAQKWLKERLAGLRELNPQTDEEFEDQVDELKWEWSRELLPFVDRRRHDVAWHKTRTILKQKEFFEDLKLFQPLAVKHPTMHKRKIRQIQDIECKELELNPHWLHNEEKIAGFTYEDWVRSTNGEKFDSEEWSQPKVGDLVSGTVMAMNLDGAFLEIGAKSWAFMPIANISLSAISTPGKVLTMGENYDCRVVAADVKSVVGGDSDAKQYILSLTELLRVNAWDEITAIMNAEEGTSPIMEVEVTQMRPFGAIVQTKSGLEGFIPNAELADKAGDIGLAGQKITVELKSADRELAESSGQRSGQALTFSYKNFVTKELAGKLEEGNVVEATIIGLRDASLDISVMGTQCQIRKIDLSGTTNFKIEEVFKVDQVLKVAVISKLEKTGEIRFSLRALEPKKGMALSNPQKVFDEAEATAEKYFTRMLAEKAKLESVLDGTFEGKSGSSGLDGDQEEDDVF